MLKKNRVQFLGCQVIRFDRFFCLCNASLYFIFHVVKSIYLGFGSNIQLISLFLENERAIFLKFTFQQFQKQHVVSGRNERKCFRGKGLGAKRRLPHVPTADPGLS